MRGKRTYYVYVVGSITGTIYTGVTSDLSRRVEEHKSKVVKGFSFRYGTYRLLYYEEFDDVYEAIERESRSSHGGGGRSWI